MVAARRDQTRQRRSPRRSDLPHSHRSDDRQAHRARIAAMDAITLPHDNVTFAARLFLAAVFGGAIGFNREMYLKPAGLRTHALVCLGAALMAYIGLQLGSSAADGAAASRIVQGMVAGIGFIGGGVILRNPRGRTVHGLTTASSIWVVAAIGVA